MAAGPGAGRTSFDPWRWPGVAAEVMAAPFATPSVLAAWQTRRLRALLAHAKSRSRLYGRLLERIDPAHAALQDLPITHKRELMAQFDDWVTDPAVRLEGLRRFMSHEDCIGDAYPGGYTVWQSSGSSGEPGVFVQDSRAMGVYDALEAERRVWSARRWLDPWCIGERIVFVGATNGHFAGVVSLRRLRRLNVLLAGCLQDVSFLVPTGQLVSRLNAMAPTVIATYPSAALLLAGEFRGGRLRARPREVWTGGESMSPAARRHIEEAFGCAVLDSYGASEFLAIASQCRHGRLHLNSDWVLLESVDGQGRPVPAGQLGATTLLTNLANHVQPIVRYDLGDRIALQDGRCSCGALLPVVEVHGRHDDTLHLVSQGAHVSVLPLAVCTVLEDEGLVDFQVVQLAADELELRAVRQGDEALRRAADALGHHLRRMGASGIRIRCRRVKGGLLQGPSGKVKRVIALSPRETAAGGPPRRAARVRPPGRT